MLEHVGAAKQSCPDPAVMVEQRVDFSRWVRQGFGTADALIIADGTLHIIDLKYGSGIEVSAEDNPQLKCYGLGALDQFGDLYDIDEVRLTIYQPRRQNVSEWRLPASDLLAWADTLLKPAADLTWAGKGDVACRPCSRIEVRSVGKFHISKLLENQQTTFTTFAFQIAYKRRNANFGRDTYQQM